MLYLLYCSCVENSSKLDVRERSCKSQVSLFILLFCRHNMSHTVPYFMYRIYLN